MVLEDGRYYHRSRYAAIRSTQPSLRPSFDIRKAASTILRRSNPIKSFLRNPRKSQAICYFLA